MQTIIDINLKKREDFYCKYSNKILNNELKNYIFDSCYGDNYKNKIIINLNMKFKVSDNEKNEMIDVIRRTFGLKVQDELYYFEKSKFKKTILFLIGIVLIIFYYLAYIGVIREIILILGWLSIWESVYSFLTDSKRNYIYIFRLKQLAKARIYFNYLEQDSKS